MLAIALMWKQSTALWSNANIVVFDACFVYSKPVDVFQLWLYDLLINVVNAKPSDSRGVKWFPGILGKIVLDWANEIVGMGTRALVFVSFVFFYFHFVQHIFMEMLGFDRLIF